MAIQRILWLAPFPIPGQSSHPAPWILTLAERLGREPDIELTILSYSGKAEDKEVRYHLPFFTLVVLQSPSWKLDLLTLYQRRIMIMRNWLKRHHRAYDVIHIHGTEHQYEVAAIDIPVGKVVSIQGLLHRCLPVLPERMSIRRVGWMLGAWYEKRYIRRYRHFSCRTHWDSASIRALNPGAVLHHSWEMMRPAFWMAEPVDFSKNCTVLFMGGCNDLKGIGEMLRVMDYVKQQRVGMRLKVVGACRPEQLKRLAERLSLSVLDFGADVECTGPLDAAGVVAAMQGSFCLFHPSHIDNSPNSVCEAQVLGLPVIATEVGGVASLIQHGETGLLVRPFDIGDMQCMLLQLFGDKALQQRLSAVARAVAAQRHHSDTILAHTKEIYTKTYESHNGYTI